MICSKRNSDEGLIMKNDKFDKPLFKNKSTDRRLNRYYTNCYLKVEDSSELSEMYFRYE